MFVLEFALSLITETRDDAHNAVTGAALISQASRNQARFAIGASSAIVGLTLFPLLLGQTPHLAVLAIAGVAVALALAARSRMHRLERALWLSQARAGIVEALIDQRRAGTWDQGAREQDPQEK